MTTTDEQTDALTRLHDLEQQATEASGEVVKAMSDENECRRRKEFFQERCGLLHSLLDQQKRMCVRQMWIEPFPERVLADTESVP